MKAPFFFIFFSFLFCISANSQVETHFILKGKIVDQANDKALPYAHIGIPSLGIGTTSSDLGEFKLRIPVADIEKELTVSYIGYEAYRKKVSALGNPAVIKLKEESSDLIEIEVMDQAAVENIIRKAVNRIPKNYPTFPHTNLAFYREARTGKDSN